MPISMSQYSQALRLRYKDLRLAVVAKVAVPNSDIENMDELKEMKLIARIAKLHGVDVKD